jgi:hypothetical protein
MKINQANIENIFLESETNTNDAATGLANLESMKAFWFLSSFSDSVWTLRLHNSYFNDETQEWENVKNIYWPDLPEDRSAIGNYSGLIDTIKSMVFFAREGFNIFKSSKTSQIETQRSTQQYQLAKSLIRIVKWMDNHEYQQYITGFRELTPSDFELFVSDAIHGAQYIDGTYHLIDSFLSNAADDGTISKYITNEEINFTVIADELNLHLKHRSFTRSPRLAYMLKGHGTAQTRGNPAYQSAEFNPTRLEKIENDLEKPVSKSTLEGLLFGFKAIGKFASIMQELEGLDWCKDYNVEDLVAKYGFRHKEKTPTIPIDTALEYLNHSIRWVVELGSDIVKLKHNSDSKLLSLMDGKKSNKDHFSIQVSTNMNKKILDSLNEKGLKITRYNAHAPGIKNGKIRDDLSVEEAVDCLVAACFILIGTFACKRISEVLDLTRNCSKPSTDGGWELIFGLRKASPVEALSMIGRPIPNLVNDAIDLLRDLAPINIININDNPELDPLFLSSYKVTRKPKKAQPSFNINLYTRITLFADVVSIKPTEDNCRWYVRSHELRRFFAISYFWHDRFAGLPALSWFMGHNDIDQTLHYVTEVIAATELPEEEARYSASIILDNLEDTLPGIENLSAQAMKYFNTNSLDMINQNTLEDYLTEQFKNGYRIVKQGHKTRVIYLEEHQDD